MKTNKIIFVVLLVLNFVVLMGQVYPEGAPPFARAVNIVFLLTSMLFFIIQLRRK